LESLPEQLNLGINDNAKEYMVYDFHPYFASFSARMPRFFLTRLTSEDDTVLDPFCGSGTTLVEAMLANRNSVGIDVNPLACLIAKVKTTPISDKTLSNSLIVLKEIKGAINSLYGQLTFADNISVTIKPDIPDFQNRNYWFNPHVLKELGIIKSRINTIENRDLREFCLVAFSSIIVKVSNQQHETRYKRIKKNVKPFDTYSVFEKKIYEMIDYMRKFNKHTFNHNCSVFCEDLRFSTSVGDEQVDLIVTSPPYLNAWDYNLYQRFRFFWLGFDPRKLRNLEIGAHLKHSYIQDSVERYSDDMRMCLQQMYRILKRSAYCCIVIGEAFVRGKRIDVGKIIKEISVDLGFEHQKTYTREVLGPHFSQQRSANNKTENVIVFRKA
jgi:site-specific DNA-methyltransferase (cytosine-N4-specific)